MKKTLIVTATIAAFIFCCAVSVSSRPGTIGVESCLQQYKNNAVAFTHELEILQRVTENLTKDSATVAAVKKQLQACRLAYKKIEFFAEYSLSSRLKIFNSAPVYEVEEPFSEFQHPVGMQAMEAILFDEDPAAQKSELRAQAELMHSTAAGLPQYLYGLTYTDADILDAVRLELIRMYTLGITGYDAPQLKTSLPEAAMALQSMTQVLQPYLLFYERSSADSLKENLHQCVQILSSGKDFNSFDRLKFLIGSALPLQEKMGRMISSLHFEKNNSMIDYSAAHIFSRGSIKKIGAFDSLPAMPLITLGKKLFSEKQLSGNGLRSCASCHKPEEYFSDGEITSLAFNGKSRLLRNAPSLMYAAYQHEQFLDGRAGNLRDQLMEVLTSPIEMNARPEMVVKRLKQRAAYRQLFKNAFPFIQDDSLINVENIAAAISAYERSFPVMTSAFDRYISGDETALTGMQKAGFNLFMGKAMCGSCHFAPIFNGLLPPDYAITEVESLGTTKNTNFRKPVADADSGRYRIFPVPYYIGAFKTPTVRNVAATGPYMHNGAFKTLKQVLDFYNKGGGNGMGLKNEFQTLSDKPLNLSQKEMNNIIQFLEALTDRPLK